MSVRLDSYLRRKAAGSVLLARRGEAHVAVLRNFDADTGAEVESESVSLDVTRLQRDLLTLRANVAALVELIEDLEAAGDEPAPPRTRER